MMKSFAIVALSIAVLALVVINRRTSDELKDLRHSVERAYEFQDSRVGSTCLWPGSNGKELSYNLKTWDGGRTWYAVEFDSKWKMTILGDAEKLYPGLLATLRGVDALASAAMGTKNGLSLSDPKTAKLLTDAGFTVKSEGR